MNKLLTFIILLACTFPAFAGNKVKRQTTWLTKKYKFLKETDIKKMKDVGLWSASNKGEDGFYSYFPNKNGLITFKDKSWILIISNSAHSNNKIGDITLIRSSDGKYYTNTGHVCSKIMLDAPEKIVSLETFLKTTGKGGNGEATSWKEYTNTK